MNDTSPRRAPEQIKARLDSARGAGHWMPWAGVGLAALLWVGALIWIFTSAGIAQVFAQNPASIAGVFAALLAPGLSLIVAGYMARESARSAEANAIVLQSARMLLEPAQHAREDITAVAVAIATETQNVNRAMADTRSKLDGIRKELEASVAAAIKAAEIVRADSEVLVHKMGSERTSMTQLAESLRNQSESIAKAVPRHAQMLSEAAKAAQDQVRKADETLNARLRSLEETAGNLTQRINQLDTMGAESRKRAQNLAGALMRLDEQLVQSTRMVEAATKAGELATAATKSTAESLRDAMSDAIDSALKATETITASSARASEDARMAMAHLKETGLQVEATTRSAALAAKTQADETEQRVKRLTQMVLSEGSRASHVAETDLVDRARQRIERASQLIGKMKTDDPKPIKQPSIDDMILEPPAFELRAEPAHQPAPRVAPELRGHTQEREPLFKREGGPPVASTDALFGRKPQPADDFLLDKPVAARPSASGSPPNGDGGRRGAEPANDELVLNNVTQIRRPGGSPILPEQRSQKFDPLFPPEAGQRDPAAWRDLLNTVEEVPEQRRDRSAGSMIDRLDRAGVRLGGVVSASDLRRIASASHQGERQRRRAIRDVVPGEIQRLTRLLENDRDMQVAARTFVNAEAEDALRVLAVSERAREDAHPRLSAYLLLDVVLSGAA